MATTGKEAAVTVVEDYQENTIFIIEKNTNRLIILTRRNGKQKKNSYNSKLTANTMLF